MLTANDLQEKNLQVEARSANFDHSFTCPECSNPVSLFRGAINIPHFRHQREHGCTFGVGESEVHRQAKLQIKDALSAHPCILKCEIEKQIGKAGEEFQVRPDVRAVIAKGKRRIYAAIEIQQSAISINELIRRTSAYKDRKVAVLWLLLWSRYEGKVKKGNGLYRTEALDRWLHAAYLSKVYFWTNDAIVRSVSFSPAQDDSGSSYKSFRNQTVSGDIHIADMIAKDLGAWTGRGFSVPSRKILIHR